MKRIHSATVRACSRLAGRWGVWTIGLAMVLMASAASPAWGQFTTCTGGVCYSGGNVGIGTTDAPFPLTVSAGADRVLNFRGDPTSFGWPSTLGGTILEAVNSAQNNIVPITFAASGFNFLIGNVGIGTTNPQYLLSVKGTIGAQEVIVTTTGWSDYVFQPTYRLRPLTEVAAYIQENHHLPDIPTEAEVKEKGVSLGEMQSKLLAKVEELTLRMIDADERNKTLEQQNRDLQERIARVESAAREPSKSAK